MNHSKQKDQTFIIDYLHKLGFDGLSSKLYIALLERGPLTILEASRAAHVERTKIYRLAEELIKKGIVEEIIDYKKKLLKAAPAEHLQMLILEQEANTTFLKDSFPLFQETIHSLSQISPFTKVLYYRGVDGIKQMLWNQLNASEEVVCFTFRNIEEVVGIGFWETWVYEFEERRNLILRELRTEVFYESLKEMEAHTIMKQNQHRDLPGDLLLINYEADIYNDVFAMFDWKDGEIFGVEIYNQKIADMQKHFFEVFWNMAKPDKTALTMIKNKEKYS